MRNKKEIERENLIKGKEYYFGTYSESYGTFISRSEEKNETVFIPIKNDGFRETDNTVVFVYKGDGFIEKID